MTGAALKDTGLFITAFITGAAVMIIEVMGSRVMGPYFGASLYIWTSLISVTLLSLALGYAVGGWIIDRYKNILSLVSFLIIAGCLVIGTTYIRIPVIEFSLGYDLRAGSLLASVILFGPQILLLGAITPQLSRLLTHDLDNLGKVVGGVYAISTIGSVIGTLVVGFVLIPRYSIDQIFMAVGLILILLGLIIAFYQNRKYLLLGILPAFLMFIDGPGYSAQPLNNNGTKIEIVANSNSFYGNIKVVDYISNFYHTRELVIDGLIQGGIDLGNGLSIYEYSYVINALCRHYVPNGNNMLMVGLGAGIIPAWMERNGITTDIVELDDNIIRIAHDYFGFNPGGNVYIEDARYHLAMHDTRYDYIVVDVFTGDITPAYLLSYEAIELIKKRLTNRGIVVFNLVVDLAGEQESLRSIVKTFRQSFDVVNIYPTGVIRQQDQSVENIILVAHDGSRNVMPEWSLDGHQVHALVQNSLVDTPKSPLVINGLDSALILTDVYNPLDLLDAQVKESFRKLILGSTDHAVLDSGIH